MKFSSFCFSLLWCCYFCVYCCSFLYFVEWYLLFRERERERTNSPLSPILHLTKHNKNHKLKPFHPPLVNFGLRQQRPFIMWNVKLLFKFWFLSHSTKFKGEKPIFVPTFSRDSHFGPYLLFSPFLVLV